MRTWLDRNSGWIFAFITVMSLVIAAIFIWQSSSQDAIDIIPPPTLTPTPVAATPTPSLLRVYVSGAVIKTDVYYLKPGSIVNDAVIAAGGLAPNANEDGINMAMELKDQQHIYVPVRGEENPLPPVQNGTGSTSPRVNNSADLINLNTASLADFEKLPRIGSVLAQRIIDYRESVGSFTTIEQLKEVDGIGEAIFREIEPLVTVE